MKFSKTFFIALLLTSFLSLNIVRAETGIEIKAINGEVRSLYKAGKYDEALKLAQKSLQITEERCGPEHPDTAYSLYALAALYESQGDLAIAEPLYQRALSIEEKILIKGHPKGFPITATGLGSLAWFYKSQGDDKTQGDFVTSQGHYATAKSLYQRALNIREKVFGKEHPDIVDSLYDLAALYESQVDNALGKSLFQRGNDRIQSRNEALEYYVAAESLYQRALSIQERALGKEHPDTIASLNKLASLYKSQGDYVTAKSLYQRALNIQERALGEEHPDTIASLNKLAELYISQGRDAKNAAFYEGGDRVATRAAAKPFYQRALPFYQRALSIQEKALGKEQLDIRHLDIVNSIDNLARVYEMQEDYATAKSLYQRALDIKEKILGKGHSHTVNNLSRLASLYYSQGDYAAAKPLYQRILSIEEKISGKEHFITKGTRKILLELESKLENEKTQQ